MFYVAVVINESVITPFDSKKEQIKNSLEIIERETLSVFVSMDL